MQPIPQVFGDDKTPLYHAQYQAIAGITFQLGTLTLFAPTEDTRLFLVSPAALAVTALVEDGPVKAYILADLTDRLVRLGGGS